MKIGLIPNIEKSNVINIINDFITLLEESGIEYLFSENLAEFKSQLKCSEKDNLFKSIRELGESVDVIVSLGGDGTMLNTAYELRGSRAPLLGLNLGKLGFLAEFEMKDVPSLVKDLQDNSLVIEERMTLCGFNVNERDHELVAINDLVIDKGRWPKMIELTIKVDNDYVSTFSADGIIVATPTGSTGYSLSTGGPIVNPKADAITISPISPHTLTMRPLVLSSNQKIEIQVRSPELVQVSCDGQRVHYFDSPVTLEIFKSNKPVRLIHSTKTNYFEILRNKLYWGLDIRKNNV
jgi:NAD+ kinase